MSTPPIRITLTPCDVIGLRDGGFAVTEIEDEPRCAHCNGTNLDVREERDDSVGYHAEVLWCGDCRGRAD